MHELTLRSWRGERHRPRVTTPEDAADALAGIEGSDREVAALLTLDVKHRALTLELLSVGTVGNTFMRPREAMRLALLRNAVAVVAAHTHPSGDLTPSEDDLIVWRKLQSAGRLLGIDVLDALILEPSGGWVSLERDQAGDGLALAAEEGRS